MNRTLDLMSSTGVSLLRGANGIRIGHLGERAEQPIELYEFEACPFCRKVREAICILDLDAFIKPCPKGGHRFRDELLERGGKLQFPYMVDPNTGEAFYESDDIVRYLFERYGAGRVPALLTPPLATLSSAIAAHPRPTAGSRARPSKAPELPLELWAFEPSPFCRLAREALCELELPYVHHSVAKGSPKRPAFEERSGKMMVPYLADPNTQTELFESADIVVYLHDTYGA